MPIHFYVAADNPQQQMQSRQLVKPGSASFESFLRGRGSGEVARRLPHYFPWCPPRSCTTYSVRLLYLPLLSIRSSWSSDEALTLWLQFLLRIAYPQDGSQVRLTPLSFQSVRPVLSRALLYPLVCMASQRPDHVSNFVSTVLGASTNTLIRPEAPLTRCLVSMMQPRVAAERTAALPPTLDLSAATSAFGAPGAAARLHSLHCITEALVGGLFSQVSIQVHLHCLLALFQKWLVAQLGEVSLPVYGAFADLLEEHAKLAAQGCVLPLPASYVRVSSRLAYFVGTISQILQRSPQ